MTGEIHGLALVENRIKSINTSEYGLTGRESSTLNVVGEDRWKWSNYLKILYKPVT